MKSVVVVISLSFLLLACSSPSGVRGTADASTAPALSDLTYTGVPLPANEEAYRRKILDFYRASTDEVILPYIDIIRAFDQLPEQQWCEPHNIKELERALSLNPSSLIANYTLNNCQQRLAPAEQSETFQRDIEGITDILTLKNKGKTIGDAIEIREVDEAYVVLNQLQLGVLDVEIDMNGDEFVYKFYVVDPVKHQASIRYFRNSVLLQKIYANMGSVSPTPKQVTNISIATYVKEKVPMAMLALARSQFRSAKVQNARAILLPLYHNSPVAATLLAQALYTQQLLGTDIDPDLLDQVLSKTQDAADAGLPEAYITLAEYILLNAKKDKQLEKVKQILDSADRIVKPGLARDAMIYRLAQRPKGVGAVKRWYDYQPSPELLEHISATAGELGRTRSDMGKQQVSLLQFAAEHHSLSAKYKLAFMYKNGDGVARDREKALALLRQTADEGYSNGQLDLGYYYATGQLGLTADKQQALSWYQKSAEQGNSYALHNIADYYEKGTVIDKNLSTALEYFLRSAQKGYAEAWCRAGRLHTLKGELQDLEQAKHYFDKGREANAPRCSFEMAKMYLDQYKDPQQALYYFEQAEKQGYIQASMAIAQAYREGSWLDKNTAKAIASLKRAADKGHGPAAFDLGRIYSGHPKGFEDRDKAIHYYKIAAKKGYGNAYTNLGHLYEQGLNGTSDPVKAFKYYEKASQLGSSQGMNNLALLYQSGQAVEKDLNRAISLFEKAAELGNGHAMTNLGALYFNGKGVKSDLQKAQHYFELAAQQGGALSQHWLALVSFLNATSDEQKQQAGRYLQQAIKTDFAPADFLHYEVDENSAITQKQKLAFLQFAAQQGDPQAPLYLGEIYEQGKWADRDHSQAMHWFQIAEKRGNIEALPYIGGMHFKGQSVAQNSEKALVYFSRYAKAEHIDPNAYIGNLFYFGSHVNQDFEQARHYFTLADENAIALNNLGEMYRLGQGTEKDLAKAIGLYLRAAMLNSDHARYNLGQIYRDGEGNTEVDYAKAMKWFTQAAENGFSEAQYALGMMFAQGLGVETDLTKANHWLQLAAQAGYANAQFELGKNLLNGTGIDKNANAGRRWLLESARQGSKSATQYLKQYQSSAAKPQ